MKLIFWKRKAKYFFGALLLCCLFFLWNIFSATDVTVPQIENTDLEFFIDRLKIDKATFASRVKRYEQYRASEPSRTGPGEKGAAYVMSAEERTQYTAMFAAEAFNKIASDKIALDRSLNDYRLPQCRDIVYPKRLPTASVIIIFMNEAMSSLLRTVHSVVNRSPAEYLMEIILVDDVSNRTTLITDLDGQIAKFWPDGIVKLLRLKERHGLIRARLAGARVAKGDVLIFLDSHCEATAGWLEPIVARIGENHKAVLCPTVSGIMDSDLSFAYGGSYSVGSFWWSLHFTWESIPEHEKQRRKKDTDPLRSSTMPGGLFAANRQYFFDIGGYDEGMEVWGGENLEISFRTWMCGGVLEFIPCSIVGHIFRGAHPYPFPDKKRDYHGLNSARLAEVWMDEYKRLFYKLRPDLVQKDYGDVSSRKQLREKLGCKSFKWFLQNVVPEKFIPDENVVSYGKVRNPTTSFCLDLLQQNEFERRVIKVGVYFCQASAQQLYSFTHEGLIRREWGCVEDHDDSHVVHFLDCHDVPINSQKWKSLVPNNSSVTAGKLLQNVQTGRCLDAAGLSNGQHLLTAVCDMNSLTQRWLLE